jgi:hypothetical protein
MSSSASASRNFVPRSDWLGCARGCRSDERHRFAEEAVHGRGGKWLGRVESGPSGLCSTHVPAIGGEEFKDLVTAETRDPTLYYARA